MDLNTRIFSQRMYSVHKKKSLIFIFNFSINQDIFPDLMKTAKIRPIFKKGDNI